MKKQKTWLIATVFIIIGCLAGCGKKSGSTVTLAGSTAFQSFAEELGEMYMKKNPSVRITVQGGGSTVGIQSAKEGVADIGMADLLTLPPDVTSVLTSVIVAKDGIAIIVHPSNRLSNISRQQAQAVFSGRVKNWREIGGADGPINLISREEGSGTRKSFEQLILKEQKLAGGAMFQDSNGTIREAVATNPNAIGYISIGLLSDRVRALDLDRITPENKNVANGTYPLSRPVFFLTKGEPSGPVKEFIDFVLSGEAQSLIREKGLIPVTQP